MSVEHPNDEIDALYGVPLGEFVAGRDALAKRLRDEGRRDEADQVKALRKPSAPAGAINLGVRADAAAAKRLLKAGSRLQAAHEAALGGRGAEKLREAMAEETAAVEAMAEATVAAAGDDSIASAMLDRVRDTLRSVASDEELREEFEAGRVVRDRKPVGIGGGLAPAPSGGRRAAKPREPTAAQRRKAEQRVTRARKALDAAAQESRAAADDVKRAQRDLRAAEGRAERAEAKRTKAEAALEVARDKLAGG